MRFEALRTSPIPLLALRTLLPRVLWITLLCCLGSPDMLLAQGSSEPSLQAQLSSQEAWVGETILLELRVNNANRHSRPDIEVDDGLEIAMVRAPSRSTSVKTIGGRTTRVESTVYLYQITPTRIGRHTISPISVMMDGKLQQTAPLEIVVSDDETEDVIMAEVVGQQDRVYVGQTLKVVLKLWIRPYRDRERRIKLNEANMWQLIQSDTEWGFFQQRLDELAAEDSRPLGEEVLREDSTGEPRGYYLYQIEADIYPQRPGPLEMGDVNIVMRYPTGLDIVQRRVSSIFGDDDFFGGSMLDDLFPGRFNRKQLRITSSNQVTASVAVPSIEVIDVPQAGRPADYRGAVGQYVIGTQLQPTKVNAGDPVTLQIIVRGNGPMDLVQAPPISDMPELTADFKVSDDTLAGFVQDDAKLFTTTIRPKDESVTRLPPIPFTFFNPETEKFETAYSNPVAIRVDPADTLSLDSIVGPGRRQPDASQQSGESLLSENETDVISTADWSNPSVDEMMTETTKSAPLTWMMFLIPPLGFGVAWVIRHRQVIAKKLHLSAGPISIAIKRIQSAESASQILHALQDILPADMPSDVREIVSRCNAAAYSPQRTSSLDDLKSAAIELLKRHESDLASPRSGFFRRATTAAMVMLTFASSTFGIGPELNDQNQTLSVIQQRALLDEANAAYQQAVLAADTDESASPNGSPDAGANAEQIRELLTKAVSRYELVAETGLRSSALFCGLGNAQLRLDEPAQALAAFEQAWRFAPGDRRVAAKLNEARDMLNARSGGESESSGQLAGVRKWWGEVAEFVTRFYSLAWRVALVAWTGFWLNAIGGLFWPELPYRRVLRVACIALFVLALVPTVIGISRPPVDGVVVSAAVMREADGDGFAKVSDVTPGQRIWLTDERGDWLRVRLEGGVQGWMPRKAVVQLRS